MLDYKDYYSDVKKQFENLIESRKSSESRSEKEVQLFFEKHPFTLLTALSGINSQYSIFGSLIISQPRFKSFDGDRHPDFLIVTANSLNLYFNFIEIEDPSKKIFSGTKQDPSKEFLQAWGQLNQWNTFGKNEVVDYCNELLRSLYKDNFDNQPNKLKHYNYILLYGFADEVKTLGERYNHILQGHFKISDMYHCTYSRLLSNIRFQPRLFTVKKDMTINGFKAIGWVPFTQYKISEWSDFRNISGKENIISASDLLTQEQKSDLINQIKNIDKMSVEEIIKLNNSGLGTSLFEALDI